MSTDTETQQDVIVRALRCSQCDGIIRVLSLFPGEVVPTERCANCTLDTAAPRWMNGNEPREDDEDDDEEAEDERYTCAGCGHDTFTHRITYTSGTDTSDYDLDTTELHFEDPLGYGPAEDETSCQNCGQLVDHRIVNVV